MWIDMGFDFERTKCNSYLDLGPIKKNIWTVVKIKIKPIFIIMYVN